MKVVLRTNSVKRKENINERMSGFYQFRVWCCCWLIDAALQLRWGMQADRVIRWGRGGGVSLSPSERTTLWWKEKYLGIRAGAMNDINVCECGYYYFLFPKLCLLLCQRSICFVDIFNLLPFYLVPRSLELITVETHHTSPGLLF